MILVFQVAAGVWVGIVGIVLVLPLLNRYCDLFK